jgi:hypothetical protein
VTRAELVRIVDIVRAAWPAMDGNHQATVRTWWRYLQDLDYKQVLAEIDRRVVMGGWPPRVGEVRRATMIGSSPATGSQQAWAMVLERLRAVETGTEWNELPEEVSEAMRACGFDGRSRPDERAFKAAYEQVVAEREERLLAVSDPEPFGEIK